MEYLIYKEEIFRQECAGDHVSSNLKYICDLGPMKEKIDGIEISMPRHPYTDNDPHRLFEQIASFYKKGDKIRTLGAAEIIDLMGEETMLNSPLSQDELRILSITLLQGIKKTKIGPVDLSEVLNSDFCNPPAFLR